MRAIEKVVALVELTLGIHRQFEMEVGSVYHRRTKVQLRTLLIQLHGLLDVLFTARETPFETNRQVVQSSRAVARLCGFAEKLHSIVSLAWHIVELEGSKEVDRALIPHGRCLGVQLLRSVHVTFN